MSITPLTPTIRNTSSSRFASVGPTTASADGARSRQQTPRGDTYAELLDDLMRMLQDAREWKPVAFDDLRVGMQFERTEANDTTRRGFE